MSEAQKKEVSGETSKVIVPQKTKTIKIEQTFKRKDGTQGKIEIDYAKVSARVAEFNKLHKNGSIVTNYEFKEGWGIFKATVVLDVKQDTRIFTGTSMGKVGAVKAFEKLETIAVGRALAFAGFLSDGEIASSEEMRNYEEATTEVNTDEAIKKLTAAKTLEELQKAWVSLTEAERQNKFIQTYKEQLKKQYANTPSGTKEPGMVRTPQGKDNGDGAKEDSGQQNA